MSYTGEMKACPKCKLQRNEQAYCYECGTKNETYFIFDTDEYDLDRRNEIAFLKWKITKLEEGK